MKDMYYKMKKTISQLDRQSLNVIENVMGSFVIQGGSMLVSLFTMPAYYKYFDDKAVLGCWFTILSILNCILTFDLGLGNGLRNKLTDAIARADDVNAKKIISSSYFFLIPIVFVITCFVYISAPHIDWNNFFNITSDDISLRSLVLCVQIVSCGVMIQFVLKLVSACLYAIQKAAIVNLLTLISNTSILIFVLLYRGKNIEENLLALSIVNVFAVNFPLFIATCLVFFTALKDYKPHIRYFNVKTAMDIFKMGMVFFWLQVIFMFVTSLNEFLISQFASPSYVPEYQIYFKLFNLVSSICMLALTPVWSSITKAQAEKKYTWILKTYKICQVLAVGVFVMEIAIVPFLQLLVNIWLGKSAIKVNYEIALIFAITNGMIVWNNVNSVIANGLGYFKPQFIYLTLAAILKVPLSYILFLITGKWYMIVFASFFAMLPVNIIQPILLKKFVKQKI